MSFKEISYLQFWQPFCSAEQNGVCNFGRGHYKKHLCEIIFEIFQWFRRRYLLNTFLIYTYGGHFVQWGGIICAILVEDIMRNISLKLFLIWTSGSGDAV